MTKVSTTDRFELFRQLNKLVDATPTFTYLNVNIVDVALSPLYLSLLSLNSAKQATDASMFSSLLGRFKEKVTSIRQQKQINRRIKESHQRYKTTPYLFFPVEPTHLSQMIPVLHYLKKKDVEFLIVTNRLSVYDKLITDGFQPVLIEYPGRQENTTVETVFGKSGEEALKNLVEEHIDPLYAQQYSKHFSDILDYYTLPLLQQLSDLLLFVKPEVIVVGYDITLEGRILTRLARQMDIRSVCIQHGSISGEPLDHCHIVDNFLAYGDAARDYLISRGLSPLSCIVTGPPYLDNMSVENRLGNPNLKQLLAISEEQSFILVALSGPGHSTSRQHFNKIVTTLLQASADHPGYQFVIKLHRKDNLANYKELIHAVPENRVLIIENGKYNFEIFDWLADCDLLITGTSTVAQEAMLMQVPVMTIDLMNEYHDVDFIDQKCTVHIQNAQEVSKVIYSILEEAHVYQDIIENARNYAQYFFSVLDGNASARCAAVILGNNRINFNA